MTINELKIISGLPYFTKDFLRQVEESKNALDFNLKYWQRTGKIIVLKSGMYLLSQNWEKERDKDGLREFLANKMIEPSYLSFEYVLQKYGLLTEAATTITSATTKTPRSFANKIGRFVYFSLNLRLFTGFVPENFGQNKVMVAKPAKALFDFIYLRSRLIPEVTKNWIAELRINWDNLSKDDFKEFKMYIETLGTEKMRKGSYD